MNLIKLYLLESIKLSAAVVVDQTVGPATGSLSGRIFVAVQAWNLTRVIFFVLVGWAVEFVDLETVAVFEQSVALVALSVVELVL